MTEELTQAAASAPPTPPASPHLYLSHSSIELLRSCPRKFWARKISNAMGVEGDSYAADAGNAIHRAVEAYVSSGSADNGTAALMSNWPFHFDNGTGARTIENAYFVYNKFVNSDFNMKYEIAHINVNGTLRPAVEVPFKINFPDVYLDNEQTIPISYIGYIDAIKRDTVTGRIVTIDYKTTAKRRTDFTASFVNSTQALPYGFVIERAVDAPIEAGFEVIYLVMYLDTKNPRIQPVPSLKAFSDVQEWVTDMFFTIRQLQTQYAMRHWSRNGNACDTFNKCQFFDGCGFDLAGMTSWLELKFPSQPPRPHPAVDSPWIEIDLRIPGLNT